MTSVEIVVLAIFVLLNARELLSYPVDFIGLDEDNIRTLPFGLDLIEKSAQISTTTTEKVIFENKTQVENKPRLTSRMRQATVLGILAGGMRTQTEMRNNLVKEVTNLVDNLNHTSYQENLQKIRDIEITMQRDRRAFDILLNSLDLLIGTKTFVDYKRHMADIASKNYQANLKLKNLYQINGDSPASKNDVNIYLRNKLKDLHRSIPGHMDYIQKRMAQKMNESMEYLKGHAELPKELLNEYQQSVFKNNMVNRRQDREELEDQNETEEGAVDDIETKESQEKKDDESESEEDDAPAGMGLVGLIAGLSGGDEGSDVGALVAALAGVIQNLFGPGGLDVPGLLGTAGALLSGLLGGGENFGKVLGGYVGITVEGLSGGGADNNGLFFGNLLGAVIAQLSADPEDEDRPLRPKLFLEKFFNGLQEAKRKGGTDGDAETINEHSGGSNLFGFIAHIVSSVVGGVTSVILNAALGSSGGSSQGSGDFSAGKPSGHPAAEYSVE